MVGPGSFQQGVAGGCELGVDTPPAGEIRARSRAVFETVDQPVVALALSAMVRVPPGVSRPHAEALVRG